MINNQYVPKTTKLINNWKLFLIVTPKITPQLSCNIKWRETHSKKSYQLLSMPFTTAVTIFRILNENRTGLDDQLMRGRKDLNQSKYLLSRREVSVMNGCNSGTEHCYCLLQDIRLVYSLLANISTMCCNSGALFHTTPTTSWMYWDDSSDWTLSCYCFLWPDGLYDDVKYRGFVARQ